MLTHANAIAMVAGALHAGIDLSASDVHLSYLPLAHVFERLVQALCWTVGAAVGFYQVGVHPLAPCDGACDRGD
jgi:long-chain acyl-CoA synthetase